MIYKYKTPVEQLTLALIVVLKGKMALPLAKRKRTEEQDRLFNDEWTVNYYFIEHKNKPFCLLCFKDLSMNCFKTSNLSRHYETVHVKKKNPACELTGERRKN